MDIDATIVGIVPFEMQDETYYKVYYTHDDDTETVLQARLPKSAIYESPHPNDTVRIHYVVGVVTQITKQGAINSSISQH